MQDKNRSECKTRLDIRVFENIRIFHYQKNQQMELITDRKSNTFHTSTNKNFLQIVISNVPNYKPHSSRNETCYVTRVSHTSTNDLFPRRHRCVSHELVRDYKTAAVVTSSQISSVSRWDPWRRADQLRSETRHGARVQRCYFEFKRMESSSGW